MLAMEIPFEPEAQITTVIVKDPAWAESPNSHDEGVYRDEDLKPLKNLVSALFRLENSRDPERIREVVTALLDWLAAPEQASLRRAFTVWFNRVFFPSRGKEMIPPEFEELTEVRAMLAETVAEWKEEWKRDGLKEGLKKGRNEGLKKGLKKGRNEGRKEGEANILLKLIEMKFGQMSLIDRKRVQSADSETLLRWGKQILTANKMDEIFRL